MPTQSICLGCGAEIAFDAPSGHCMRCMLDLALAPRDFSRPSEWMGRFGDYELVEEIGRGAVGIVYKARKLSSGQLVALKMLINASFQSDQVKERFIREARAFTTLDHPNIVKIYEVSEFEGHPFITMQLVPGKTLEQCLAATHFTRQKAVELIATLAHTLHHSHSRGILHRDIKPSNILIDQFNRPYLADFGLAKFLFENSDLTRTVTVIGTPAYTSPEQALGHSRDVTPGSDIFSLGVLFYRLLTGVEPFRGSNTLEILRKITDEDPQPPQNLNPEIDIYLSDICLKCLHKNPADRYTSAQQLGRDLMRYLHFELVKVGPSRIRRVKYWCRRHPRAVLALIALPLLLIMLALGFLAGSLWTRT